MKPIHRRAVAASCLAIVATGAVAQTNPDQPPTGMSMDEYEATIMGLPTFAEAWEQKAPAGNVATDMEFESLVIYEPGEQKVFPKDGQILAYIATGVAFDNPFQRPADERISSKSTRITVIDAVTKEIVAWNELPVELGGSIHGSPMSPDGRYMYLTGPIITNLGIDTSEMTFMECDEETMECDNLPPDAFVPSTIVKVDALTLEVVEVFKAPGKLHHGHVFREDYMIFDAFKQEGGGANMWILDPKTDEIVSAVREQDIGGFPYTIWTNHDDSDAYILMEPTGYVNMPQTGYFTSYWLKSKAGFAALKNFWVAKVDISEDMKAWEISREYPYFGYRANWVEISADEKSMYLAPGSNSIAEKIDLETGQMDWSVPVGDGPYATELNADGSELWVVGKGETTGLWGHDIYVVDTKLGRRIDAFETGYITDHLLLTPNGKEIWATSNGSGKIFVYEASSHEMTYEIHIPGYGDAHGLPFVYYETADAGRVIMDQHGFHGEYDPQQGRPMGYETASWAGETVIVEDGTAVPDVNADQAAATPEETMPDPGAYQDANGEIWMDPHPEGDPIRGKDLFQSDIGCNICHDMTATGGLGPNIRQVDLAAIDYAVANHKDMQIFAADFPEMFERQVLKDIQSYLATLPRVR